MATTKKALVFFDVDYPEAIVVNVGSQVEMTALRDKIVTMPRGNSTLGVMLGLTPDRDLRVVSLTDPVLPGAIVVPNSAEYAPVVA